jgi:hypothetical protein
MSTRVCRRGALLALAVAIAALVLACQPMVLPGRSEPGVTIDELLADPGRYVGRRVTASGQVDRVVSAQVIALRSPASIGEVLAIVGDQAVSAVDAIEPGETIQVAATVQMMDREQIRQVELQLGVQLDEERLLSLAERSPFLIAQRVSK